MALCRPPRHTTAMTPSHSLSFSFSHLLPFCRSSYGNPHTSPPSTKGCTPLPQPLPVLSQSWGTSAPRQRVWSRRLISLATVWATSRSPLETTEFELGLFQLGFLIGVFVLVPRLFL